MDTERPISDFVFTPDFVVDEHVEKAFDRNGYIILRKLFNDAEVSKLRSALENDEGVVTQAYGRKDGGGRKSKVVLWNQPGNDITGIISRTEKLAGTFEKLIGGEVYHYHAKVILKEARTGGQHNWHQDYGYWYENGCLFPDMGTTWTAIDRADRGNGCVQILVGSHRMGRLDHVPVEEQIQVDPKRLEMVRGPCPLLYAELDPGDTMFFHSNLIHRSDQNSSDRRRWSFLVAYNRADNNPVMAHHHPFYTPLNKVPDSAILECTTSTDMTGKDFFVGPKGDPSLQKVQGKAGISTQVPVQVANKGVHI